MCKDYAFYKQQMIFVKEIVESKTKYRFKDNDKLEFRFKSLSVEMVSKTDTPTFVCTLDLYITRYGNIDNNYSVVRFIFVLDTDNFDVKLFAFDDELNYLLIKLLSEYQHHNHVGAYSHADDYYIDYFDDFGDLYTIDLAKNIIS